MDYIIFSAPCILVMVHITSMIPNRIHAYTQVYTVYVFFFFFIIWSFTCMATFPKYLAINADWFLYYFVSGT